MTALIRGRTLDQWRVVAPARNHLSANRSLAFQFQVTA